MNLTICGPNLPGKLQDKGGLHVHAAGCADLKRGDYRYLRPSDFYHEAHTCRRTVVEGFYGPEAGSFYEEAGIPESEWDTAWERYEGEFYFAPCTDSLPAEASPAWVHDPARDGGGCTWCGSFAQVNEDNLCRECFAQDET